MDGVTWNGEDHVTAIELDTGDALNLLRYGIKNYIYTRNEDMNGDGTITAVDDLMMIRIAFCMSFRIHKTIHFVP